MDRKRGKRHCEQAVVGWREWVALPDVGVAAIKVKIDSGARSSSLHAFDVETFQHEGETWVRFKIHPLQRDVRAMVMAEARVVEFRRIRSSSGHLAVRPVILTSVRLLGQQWPIELTLANRDSMGFRMLLGREAVRSRFLIDPARSYYDGRRKSKRK